ncbi:MAG: hypothetical protein KF782_02635 [Labilithrix sp.]|nr:hypothetical protein [Labilithrix sp.]
MIKPSEPCVGGSAGSPCSAPPCSPSQGKSWFIDRRTGRNSGTSAMTPSAKNSAVRRTVTLHPADVRCWMSTKKIAPSAIVSTVMNANIHENANRRGSTV